MVELLPTSTWYPYFFGKKPWGITNEVIVNSGIIPLFEKIIVDKNGFNSEERAAKVCGWTSSEIITRAKKAGLLKTEDFEYKIISPMQDDEQLNKVQNILRKKLFRYNNLNTIREFDNELTGIIANRDSKKIIHPYLYPNYSKGKKLPLWTKKAEAWIDLYFDKSTKLLPSLPKDKFQKILKNIGKKQKKPLLQLAKLELEQPEYLEIVHKLHGDLDDKIDSFLRKDQGDGNYVDKFGVLVDLWKRHREVDKHMNEEYQMLFNEKIKLSSFVKHVKKRINDEFPHYVKDKKTNKNTIKFSIGLASAGTLISLYAIPGNDLALTAFSGSIITAISSIPSIMQYKNLKNDKPFGYVKASLESFHE